MSEHAFDGFSTEAFTFLDNLKANNDRDWFADNKKTYESEIKRPAMAFCDVISAELNRRTGRAHRAKVFRVHRDVRFSKDKRPYNAHLHIAFTPESELASPPMWFFGLGTEQLSLGCGVFAFDKPELERYRQRIIGADGASLADTLKALQDDGVRLSDAALKRVPSGYDKDHPHADLLRHKGIGVWRDFQDRRWVTGADVVPRVLATFDQMRPVFDWLLANKA